MKPPFPAVSGLYACPTVVNNAGSHAVPDIIKMGGGHIKNSELRRVADKTLSCQAMSINPCYELPMG